MIHVANPAPASVFAAEFLTHVVELGVEHIVLSPGARSQALALVAADLERRGDVKLHVRIDERAAGFLALGLAVETRVPAVVINGRLAWHGGAFADGFGDQRGYGSVLRATA